MVSEARRSEIPAYEVVPSLRPSLPARGMPLRAAPWRGCTARGGAPGPGPTLPAGRQPGGYRDNRQPLRRLSARAELGRQLFTSLSSSPGGRGPIRSAPRDWSIGLSITGDFPRGGASWPPALPRPQPRPPALPGSRRSATGRNLAGAFVPNLDSGLGAVSGALSFPRPLDLK